MERKSLDNEWFNYPGVKENYRTMVYYPGDGGDTFEFNFVGGFINPADIKAFMIDDVNRDVVNLTVKVIGSNTAKLNRVVPVGWTVCIFRDTPKDRPLSVFQDGASITAKSLDRNAQQAIFAVSEMVDRFDSTVSQVETALKEVKKANDNAEAALAESKKATGIAQAAEARAEQAAQTSIRAFNTAAEASKSADQAVQTANEAKNTANALDAQIKSANATAADAKRIAEDAKSTANGIDGKATQAQKDAAAAVQTANEAKQIANGIDAKATQAQKDAAEALKKANDVEASVGTVQELSKRVDKFTADDGVQWKGRHVFAGEQTQVVSSVPGQSVILGIRPNQSAFVSYANSGKYHELTMTSGGLTYNGSVVLTNKIGSPGFLNSVVIEAPTYPRLILRNTSNSTTHTLSADTNGLPYFSYSGVTARFTKEGGTVATQEWTNTIVKDLGNGVGMASPRGTTEIANNDDGNMGFWDKSAKRWVFVVHPSNGAHFSGQFVRVKNATGDQSNVEVTSPDGNKKVGIWAYNDGRAIISAYAGGSWSNITIGGIGNGVMATREWVNSQGFVKSSGTKLGPVVTGSAAVLQSRDSSLMTVTGFEEMMRQVPNNAVFCGVTFSNSGSLRTGAPKWRVIS